MTRILRAAFVIGRRDFTATVLSRTFIFFLLGPLFPLIFALVFGTIGARVAGEAEPPVIAAAVSPQDFTKLSVARDQVQQTSPQHPPLDLRKITPEAAADAHKLLVSSGGDVVAVLTGSLNSPRLTTIRGDDSTPAEVRLFISAARGGEVPLTVTTVKRSAPPATQSTRIKTGEGAQALLFFLTMLLAGMTLSQLIEEKSNKVIEILAAAVPIEAVFLGKLFAMLMASLVGIGVWASAALGAVALLTNGGLGAIPPPALGWPVFLILTIVYFAMNYLLLGSVFLAIGAQASTVREVQTLSMPVTMAQVLIFGFAALAVGSPNSPAGIAGAVFPLSSGLVMVARAAEFPQLWPHLAALAWQILWVAAIVRMSAGLFRKIVLQSGRPRRGFRRKQPA